MPQRAYQPEGADGSRRLFARTVLEGDSTALGVHGARLRQPFQHLCRRRIAVRWVGEDERVRAREALDGALGRLDDDVSGLGKASRRQVLVDHRSHRPVLLDEVAACAAAFLADAFYEKHVILDFENWFGFFGLFGFLLSFALVLTAREMRKILMRDEDYYDG